MASRAGPMCEEPMEGVAFVVSGCTFSTSDSQDLYGPFSGQVADVRASG